MDPHFYPITERLIDGAKTKNDAAFLVDVGGGKGHDLESLKSKFPTLPGRLIPQDVPEIINLTNLSQGLEATIHDFNTPQPVQGEIVPFLVPSHRLLPLQLAYFYFQGARAYFLHNIIHDWSDDKSAISSGNCCQPWKMVTPKSSSTTMSCWTRERPTL